ncbi:MAG: PQQ-dependent sugar dehydrogenase [Candidatus Magasanikbacteria bacterium]|nr:PQQ-dependent sugar dehydrogenase [Candidatus Magasanikbacteria bacterium]
MNKKILITAIVIIIITAVLIVIFNKQISKLIFNPTETKLPSGIKYSDVNDIRLKDTEDDSTMSAIEVVAENLEIPWEIIFLPDDTMLVTERPGRLLRIYPNRREGINISGVEHRGEGGLLGAALHPDFEKNNLLYLYLTSKNSDGLINRVERYHFDAENNNLSDKKIIINNIPGASYHDGGRIAFGSDNKLYVTTGDAGDSKLAQNINSLAGKILRLNDDGSVPGDNPFDNEIWTYGHRNPQGLAWDKDNNLWSTEHGPSGVGSGFDEINLIQKGKNYGWPVIQGGEIQENMQTPIIQSGADDTWAPAGMTIVDNKLFFTGLRGEALYSAIITDDKKLYTLQTNFREDFGRLRVVRTGPDGWLYIATSNRDGRGSIRPQDDKIIKINPNLFGTHQNN